MKIAILNRDPGAHPGGDVLSLLDLSNAIKKLTSASITLFHHEKANLDHFDLVFIKHMNFPWSVENWDWALRFSKPYVLQPMYYPGSWGTDGDDMKEMVEDAALVVPYAPEEWKNIQTSLNCSNDNVRFIPNGVSEEFVAEELDPHRQGYVLAVSARAGKGEEKVENACKILGLPYKFVTDVSPQDMPEHYINARVFVNASEGERMSRTIHEALASGCRVVATKHNYGNYWYQTSGVPDSLCTVDPEDTDALVDKIDVAWSDPHWNWLPNICARQITWDVAAKYLVSAIKEVGLWKN